MKRFFAFGLLGPVMIAVLGALVYVPRAIFLSGQTSAGVDGYVGAFVVFLMMGMVPEWLNLIMVALGCWVPWPA
jgi:hypothetical protein